MNCVSFEDLVAYWSGDLSTSAAEQLEGHVFSCAECTEASERVAGVTERLRLIGPPVIDHARMESLKARGYRVDENVITPNVRSTVRFEVDRQDFIIHRLTGLDLKTAEQVSIAGSDEDTGAVLFALPSVPFDREAGEVLVACQRHFRELPPKMVLDVQAKKANGDVRSERYVVTHEFA